jgi:hypothetical protein
MTTSSSLSLHFGCVPAPWDGGQAIVARGDGGRRGVRKSGGLSEISANAGLQECGTQKNAQQIDHFIFLLLPCLLGRQLAAGVALIQVASPECDGPKQTVTPFRIVEKQIPSQDFTSGNDSMSPELLGAFVAGLTAGFTGSYFVTRMVVRGSILELRAELLRESQSIEHRLTAVESRLSQMEHHR